MTGGALTSKTNMACTHPAAEDGKVKHADRCRVFEECFILPIILFHFLILFLPLPPNPTQ